MNSFHSIGAVACLLVLAYFVPFLIGAVRRHQNAVAIFALNLFLGWTLLGWVAALVWACTAVVQRNDQPSQPDDGRAASDAPPSNPAPGVISSAAEDLSKLAALYEKGLLTEDEFKAQKSIVLSRP